MLIRASGSFADAYQDVVAGTEILVGPLTIDGEGYYQFTDGDVASGWYIGAAATLSEMATVAVRYDMVTGDGYDTSDAKIGGGVALSFAHGLFAAVEFNRTLPEVDDGVNTVAFQIGLESSLELPGFQRKTLKQN